MWYLVTFLQSYRIFGMLPTNADIKHGILKWAHYNEADFDDYKSFNGAKDSGIDAAKILYLPVILHETY